MLVCAVLTAFLTICASEEGERKGNEQAGKMMGVMNMVGTGRNFQQMQMQKPNTVGTHAELGKTK